MGQLLFKKVFWESIRAGTKRTTVRRWDKPRVVVGARAFAPGIGWLAVESVDEIEDLRRLSEADALADGFESVADMIETLLSLYPGHETDGKRWFRVLFHAEDVPGDVDASDGAEVKLVRVGGTKRVSVRARRKRRR